MHDKLINLRRVVMSNKQRSTKCRTTAIREKLVKENHVVAIFHSRLLKGQKIDADTGAKITDQYYVFKVTNREYPDKKSILYCGTHAAADFFRKTGQKPLPIFDPLKSEHSSASSCDGGGDTNKIRWNPLALELRNMCGLILCAWGANAIKKYPDGPLQKVLYELIKRPLYEPSLLQIKSINTVLGLDKDTRDMYEIVAFLRSSNPTLKNYTFELIHNFLKERGIHSNVKKEKENGPRQKLE
jgi:hypothetical protein